MEEIKTGSLTPYKRRLSESDDLSEGFDSSPISEYARSQMEEAPIVNIVPAFESSFNFSENKGTPVRPFRKKYYKTTSAKGYTKISAIYNAPATYSQTQICKL
jgi:hypothetical protein